MLVNYENVMRQSQQESQLQAMLLAFDPKKESTIARVGRDH